MNEQQPVQSAVNGIQNASQIATVVIALIAVIQLPMALYFSVRTLNQAASQSEAALGEVKKQFDEGIRPLIHINEGIALEKTPTGFRSQGFNLSNFGRGPALDCRISIEADPGMPRVDIVHEDLQSMGMGSGIYARNVQIRVPDGLGKDEFTKGLIHFTYRAINGEWHRDTMVFEIAKPLEKAIPNLANRVPHQFGMRCMRWRRGTVPANFDKLGQQPTSSLPQ